MPPGSGCSAPPASGARAQVSWGVGSGRQTSAHLPWSGRGEPFPGRDRSGLCVARGGVPRDSGRAGPGGGGRAGSSRPGRGSRALVACRQGRGRPERRDGRPPHSCRPAAPVSSPVFTCRPGSCMWKSEFLRDVLQAKGSVPSGMGLRAPRARPVDRSEAVRSPAWSYLACGRRAP